DLSRPNQGDRRLTIEGSFDAMQDIPFDQHLAHHSRIIENPRLNLGFSMILWLERPCGYGAIVNIPSGPKAISS
ncbi:MAG TPA: hypothetical protein VD767_05095, partial [Thermomicrobiales bacterium]|nr:hypothetical protein [Thermomicrobiales bacterium]